MYQYNILGTIDLLKNDKVIIRNYEQERKNDVRSCNPNGTYRIIRIEGAKRETSKSDKRVKICKITSIETFTR